MPVAFRYERDSIDRGGELANCLPGRSRVLVLEKWKRHSEPLVNPILWPLKLLFSMFVLGRLSSPVGVESTSTPTDVCRTQMAIVEEIAPFRKFKI